MDSMRPSQPDARFAAVADDEVERAVKPALAEGERLAHAAFRGPFGPTDAGVLALASVGNGFSGFVLSSGKRLDLPAFPTDYAGHEIAAVLFEDVDGDGYKEAIVMATWMTGIGPTGAQPFPGNVVFGWDGSSFQRISEVEAKIAQLPDARAVRSALSR